MKPWKQYTVHLECDNSVTSTPTCFLHFAHCTLFTISTSYAAFQYSGEPVIYCVCLFVFFLSFSFSLALSISVLLTFRIIHLFSCRLDLHIWLSCIASGTIRVRINASVPKWIRWAVFTESDDKKWFDWDYAETQRSHQLITTWVDFRRICSCVSGDLWRWFRH